MAAQSSGPAFPVHVDERELAEDLGHATEAGRAAIESMIEGLKADGVPTAWLRRCDPEAQDGTRLPGCVKLYIPQPAGQWGAVFLGGLLDDRPTLFLLAVGERHPGAPWRPSVYEVAHRRLQKRVSG
jgi:biotin operon repressor